MSCWLHRLRSYGKCPSHTLLLELGQCWRQTRGPSFNLSPVLSQCPNDILQATDAKLLAKYLHVIFPKHWHYVLWPIFQSKAILNYRLTCFILFGLPLAIACISPGSLSVSQKMPSGPKLHPWIALYVTRHIKKSSLRFAFGSVGYDNPTAPTWLLTPWPPVEWLYVQWWFCTLVFGAWGTVLIVLVVHHYMSPKLFTKACDDSRLARLL